MCDKWHSFNFQIIQLFEYFHLYGNIQIFYLFEKILYTWKVKLLSKCHVRLFILLKKLINIKNISWNKFLMNN